VKCLRAGLLSALLALTAAARVSADLDQDVSRLSSGWQPHGRVTRLEPRLAERGSPSLVFAPPGAPGRARSKCLSYAIVGPSSTHFVVRTLGERRGPGPAGETVLVSLAGMVELTRCGADRAGVSALLIEMRSPRAVLETLVVESDAAPPRATRLLPQRDPGPIDPLSLQETRLAPPPMATRLALSESRLRRDGGRELTSELVPARADGSGSVVRALSPGCHRFELLAEGAPAGPSTDLELSPSLEGPARIVSIERGDGSQLAVGICAGAEARARLDFAGAPAGSALTVSHARWPLPDGLPEAWGAVARAGMAAVLLRHQARVGAFPVEQGLGIQGPTLLPVPVEPGACYVAVVTAIGGRTAGLSLAASAAGVSAQNRSGPDGDGTLISFCARAGTRALLEVDSRGHGLVWLFALFQTGRIELGAELVP
jgi:hypothetical protein